MAAAGTEDTSPALPAVAQVDAGNVEDLALGAAVLGSGGGGDPRVGAAAIAAALGPGDAVRLTPASAVAPDAWIAAVALVGATFVMLERLPSGDEFAAAVRALQRHAGVRLDAICGLETGGANAMIPVLCARLLDLPLIDADGMGRAFPRIEQTVFTPAGISATPLVLADSTGNTIIIEASANTSVERLTRAVLPALGGWAAAAGYLMRGSDCAARAIQGTFSRALHIGAAIRRARVASSPAAGRDLIREAGGQLVFEGLVIEVRQRTSLSPGTATLEHRHDRKSVLRVELADELLLAIADGEVAAAVPDIICALDSRRAAAVAADRITAGQELDIWRFAAPGAWYRDPGAALASLPAFGLAPVGSVG
jgi:uncharacterized protein